MAKIKISIAKKKEKETYHPTNMDYIGNTMEDYLNADIKLTNFGKMIILAVVSNDFVKQNNEEFSTQLSQFSNSLNGLTGPTALANKYGFNSSQLQSIKNDALAYAYFILKHGAGLTYAKGWTDTGNDLRKGTGTTTPMWPMGDPLTSPVPPAVSVLPDIEGRFRVNAKFAKDQSIYVPADGNTMGIEVSSSPFIPSNGKPDLKVTISDGGHPSITYIKSKYQGINIYKDAGDGKGFVFCHTVNDPAYTDYAVLPAVGKSAAWVYRAFYLYKGKEVGSISKDATITVLGLVVTTP